MKAQNVEIFGNRPNQAGSWRRAVWRGARKSCPRCGRGRLFESYVATARHCAACDLDFSGHRADDAAPYLTILIVGHTTIPLALAVKQMFSPPMWMQFSIWLPLILIATFWFLPISKGAIIGLQWANRMHGFAGAEHAPEGELPTEV